ncbi:MAG: type II secretion system F family protein [Planctomycetota bacterium]
MADSGVSGGAAITLEQLIALNDEMAALMRAGVPLELGLARLGEDMPGRLGKISKSLSERMQEGRSLSEALDEEAVDFPPVYRAVVEAGLKAGRLPAALESVATSARRLAETRRLVAVSFAYPLLVVLLVWGLFLLFVVKIAPQMLQALEGAEVQGRALLTAMKSWGDTAIYWGPLLPLVVVGLAAVWWFRSRRSTLVESRTSALLLGWVPGLGGALKSIGRAKFSEVLALLVESGVPLHQAVVLAAEAAGDPRLLAAARQTAAALERGGSFEDRRPGAPGLPPLVEWLVRSGQRKGTVCAALGHAADVYHRRAVRKAEGVRLFLPLVLTVVIGGGVTLAYALLVFGQWAELLDGLFRV